MLPPSSEALKFSEVQLSHTSKKKKNHTYAEGDTHGWRDTMIDTERCSGREKEINRERDNNGKRVEMERHGEADKKASESWEDKDREFMKEK